MEAGIQVDGLREFARDLRKATGESPRWLALAHREIAALVARRAEADAPRGPTGRLRRSIRPGGTQRAAVVRAGGPRVPYFGVQEFGGTIPRRETAGISRREKRGRRAAGGSGLTKVKPYRGPTSRSRSWWDEEHGYFLFPAGRALRPQILAEYDAFLERAARIAFPD